jgi:hypothetical protein
VEILDELRELFGLSRILCVCGGGGAACILETRHNMRGPCIFICDFVLCFENAVLTVFVSCFR